MRVWRKGEKPQPRTPAQSIQAHKKDFIDEFVKAIRVVQSEKKS